MAALFWDTVGKAANLFQLLGGLDAITLITVATSFLRFHEIGKECRKLEDRVRVLRQLLLSPPGCWAMQHNLELARMVIDALKDAHDLVQSYNRSSILARVRRGRTMIRQFRDLRSTIDSYCALILSVNAVLLVGQANRTWPPPPSFFRTEVNHVSMPVPASPGDSTETETSSMAALLITLTSSTLARNE